MLYMNKKLASQVTQGRRKLFLVGGGGGLKLKFGVPSRALQVQDFIGNFSSLECLNAILHWTLGKI